MVEKTIAVNRKAHHDYFIDDVFEAGLVLLGTEIKAIRAGQVNLRDSYAQIKMGEAWLINAHIAAYKQAGRDGHEPRRTRKLLLHRYQINRLIQKMQTKGYTLIPLRLYIKDNRAKVEIGLARGKRQYDKRETIAKREAEREMDRVTKSRRLEREE
jgi:SsrA-binding protein